jgi:hypothetical protein
LYLFVPRASSENQCLLNTKLIQFSCYVIDYILTLCELALNY